ncbi:major facilitator superfamily domain-containing protein [Ilyonectria robusta]|uniref:major facilitator superfamily domain-containing protein n=1 Tax=Ilyonectria robusta TaxID=1079257 RepID=UPI001E8DE8AB|nr:major facilitator superfamily domain-containing protein [Ilyonectria robusta]KAH8729616.1 major facilitator superfamily domain-containing protein [Ilyonectria robusta]
MANDYPASLPYPNPSLGQMATLEEGGGRGRPSTAISGIQKHSVTGPQQVVLVLSLLTGLLFSSLDTSIVSTSLVTVSQDLNDFVNAPWIVLAYLLTYMGFAVCISKLSDIYGRRNMLVISWVFFVAFSQGCGSATSMTALIVCRAFQGMGASGLYSLTQIGLVEVGPSHRPSLIGAMVGATLAVAFVLGPIIGGAISQLSDWRWLFNINVPFGLVTILCITNFWPQEDVANFFSWKAFTSIDFIGSATLLTSSGFLVFAVQQAGSQTFEWKSPEIISALAISGVSWVVFVWWEVLLATKEYRRIEPIFPIRLMLRRVYSSGLLVTMFTGFPYISLSIVIPERFQIVNREGVLMAGLHILPLLGACAIGSFLGGAISSKKNNTSITLFGASCLQLLGVGLMSMLSGPDASVKAQYGFQVIFGLGVGLSFSAATIMTSILAAERSELASAQGAVSQTRVLGGCIGLSICTVIFNAHVNQYLGDHLTPEQLQDLHRSPLSSLDLPLDLQDLIRHVYAGAFAEELKVMMLVCAVMVVIAVFTLERHPAPLERLTTWHKDDIPSRRGSDSGTEMTDITRDSAPV